MTRPAVLLALALVLLPAGGPLFAQESAGTPSDPFDVSAFDQAVQQGTEQDRETALQVQFGGNFLFNSSASTTADFDGYTASGSFAGRAFVKVSVPSYGTAYLAYNFSKNLYQAEGGTPPASPAAWPSAAGDLFDSTFALSEFYLAFDIAQAVFFRMGNQLLAWGPSLVWTPVDFVNLQRADPLSSFDLRRGKPGVRATVPLGISNLFLFADLTGTVTGPVGSLVVNDPLETVNLAARWDITLLGFELGLTGLVGASIQNMTGFDFSGRVLGFDVYGELAVGIPYSAYDLSVASSLGFQRSFGELSYWTVSAEAFVNSAGTDDTSSYPALLVAGDYTPFYVGKYYAYAALTRTHLFVDGITATLSGFVNFSDLSYLLRLSTGFSVARLVPFKLGISYAGGGPGKEFTYFTGDNALRMDLRISFEF